MLITAKSPCRVDLAGGTLDIWPLFLFHRNAVTLNFAVNRYTSCIVRPRSDSRIVLRSNDLGVEESWDSIDHLQQAEKTSLPLLFYVVRFFAPQQGLEITTHSEAPAGAGISGSSALIISLVSAMNRLEGTGNHIEKIREIAQNVEAQIIRVPTGCQDYYPAMYGGVSAIELTPAGYVRKAIPVDPADFNHRVVLAYTGEPRNSGINNWEVTKLHIDGDREVHWHFDRIAAIAHEMRGALERADWAATGRLLRDEWTHRKSNAPGITTPLIDRLIDDAHKAGALGAKVCGAGGGGCVFFLVEPDAQHRVSKLVESLGAEVLPVRVAECGVQVETAVDDSAAA